LLVNGVPTPILQQGPTQISFSYPAGVPCGSQLRVQNIDGQGVNSGLNPNPIVTSTALAVGTSAGGQLFLISGQGFAQGSTVTIGGAAATVQSASATSVLVRTPAGSPGVAPGSGWMDSRWRSPCSAPACSGSLVWSPTG
jgi:hypothetical protein